jgi:type VI secretion system protein ImpG
MRACRGYRRLFAAAKAGLDIIFLFKRPTPEMADITPADFQLFVTPIVNLFERECNVIEIDRRRTRQVLHADRTRPRDFEIYRVTRVEDAEGPESEVPALFSLGQNRGSGWLTRPSAGRVGRRKTNDVKA